MSSSRPAGAIDRTAAELRRLGAPRTVADVLRVGETLVRCAYGGDATESRSHARKPVSLRRVSARMGGAAAFSPAALSRAVRSYVRLREVEDAPAWRHVKPSHLQIVLTLPATQCVDLLRRAEDERWTTRRLASVAPRRTKGGTASRARLRERDAVLRVAAQLAGIRCRLSERGDSGPRRDLVGLRRAMDAAEEQLHELRREALAPRASDPPRR